MMDYSQTERVASVKASAGKSVDIFAIMTLARYYKCSRQACAVTSACDSEKETAR